MFENIIKALKAILSANNLLQEVYDYEVADFNGQPAAVIVPSQNEGSYSSVNDNERVYAFNLFLFVARNSKQYDDEKCEKIMRELVDSVIDDFDKNWQLTGITLSTGYQLPFVEAVPSAWGYIKRETLYRMATINLKVHLVVDTTLIS